MSHPTAVVRQPNWAARWTLALESEYVPQTYRTREVCRRTGLRSSQLVSSERVDGQHGPALDVDHPTVLTVDDAGQLTVWVDAPLRRVAFHRLVGLAQRLRVTRPLSWAQLGDQARATAYADASLHCLDTTARDAVLAVADAAVGHRSLEDLIATAQAAAGTGFHAGPVMTNPWPLPLAVDAVLLPSTHHHHLYLDAALPWGEYRRLLLLARSAGLLEEGYVKMSLQRQATHLRLPWEKKPDLGQTGSVPSGY